MGELNLKDCLIYLDNIIIFSESFDLRLDCLEAIFKRLHEQNLILKASKCNFFMSEVTYLKHVISEEGIKTNPDKVKAPKSSQLQKVSRKLSSIDCPIRPSLVIQTTECHLNYTPMHQATD